MNGKELLVKVCGLKHSENILQIDQLGVDYLGFIFYSSSKRDASNIETLPQTNAKKVGVFVNEHLETIKEKIEKFQLSVVQLHGDENPEFCEKLKDTGVQVWKVFGVDEKFDFTQLSAYFMCDLFLFDTKSPLRGGTGKQFDWNLLKNVPTKHSFILSGGIGPSHAQELSELELPNLIGVDLNSKFELEPGLKDLHLIKAFIKNLK